jgi:hypothetical protein
VPVHGQFGRPRPSRAALNLFFFGANTVRARRSKIGFSGSTVENVRRHKSAGDRPSPSSSPKPSNKEASKMKTLVPVFLRASAHGLWLKAIAIALVFGGSAPYCWSGSSGQTSEIPVLSSDPWQANELIKPEQLAKWLSATTGAKPLVICVAFPVLYPGGHIAGAKFAGPTAKPEGIQALKRAANGLSQDKQIVLYCGCCPWDKCPNMRS